MVFVREQMTDEQRKQQGFAEKMDDVTGVDMRKGMNFASSWVVDRERNAYIVIYFKGSEVWKGEMGWNNETILIDSLVSERGRDEFDKDGNRHMEFDAYFKIRELIIPEKFKDKFTEIKQILQDGLRIYGSGSNKYNGIGYVEIPHNVTLRFPKVTKSALKLQDFSILH